MECRSSTSGHIKQAFVHPASTGASTVAATDKTKVHRSVRDRLRARAQPISSNLEHVPNSYANVPRISTKRKS
ncbi:jg6844 [Pararge aegeria aegeria]|uniref:Jg6844 protein n=1 Tax=Pararge aegeria aegeria TaxID=348720 RepID=A0A8S4SDL6_9NEOP|nr:jg6844 [Pararge aegeria aegeria]